MPPKEKPVRQGFEVSIHSEQPGGTLPRPAPATPKPEISGAGGKEPEKPGSGD